MSTPERFEKDLDLIIEIARAEYKTLTVDMQSFQSGMMKTYLWLSSLLVATFIASGGALLSKNTGFPFLSSGSPSASFYFFGAVSLLCALFTFCLGVDGLRGRGNTTTPGKFKKWGMAARDAPNEDPLDFRRGMVSFFDEIVTTQTGEVNRIGLRLRKMSWLLLLSVAFAVLALLAFCL